MGSINFPAAARPITATALLRVLGHGVLLCLGAPCQQTKPGVGREGSGEMLRSIGAVFQIRVDHPVKANSCFRGRRRNRQPMLVLKHQRAHLRN